MTLQFLTGEMNYFTEKIASETVKLNYAGIAIVWMFRSEAGLHWSQSLAIALYVLSLIVYMIFLWYAAHKVHQTFQEQEKIIEADSSIPDGQKETYDFGGWDKKITDMKILLRRIFLGLCLAGYVCIAFSMFLK